MWTVKTSKREDGPMEVTATFTDGEIAFSYNSLIDKGDFNEFVRLAKKELTKRRNKAGDSALQKFAHFIPIRFKSTRSLPHEISSNL